MNRRFPSAALVCLAVSMLAPAARAQDHPVVLKARKLGKSLYLPVEINGQPFWFAVDSGAYQGVVDPLVAKQAGLTVLGDGVGAGHGARRCTGEAPGPAHNAIRLAEHSGA